MTSAFTAAPTPPGREPATTASVSGLGPGAEHHLVEIGFHPRPDTTGGWRVASAPGGPGPVTVRSANPPAGPYTPPDREEAFQAACGLMDLYGLREGEGPRRIGLDYTTTVRAVVTGQGALAALLARARGLHSQTVHVDAIASTLLVLGHYLAIAEAEPDTYLPRAGTGRPPPFLTRDGCQVEIETFRPHNWGALWTRLGADAVSVGHAWREHGARQWTASCRMPEALHQVVAAHSLTELRAAARDCDVAVIELQPQNRYRASGRPWTSRAGPVRRPGTPRPTAPSHPARPLPLEGITVVECTRFLQGPYAGRVLAMLGANVVLVELPEGDPTRDIEPVVDGCFAGFRALHRGKHSVRLDLTTVAGRDDLRDLLAEADVFLHNWPDGRAERLGLTPQRLWRTHPHLVCAHASGWAPLRGSTLPEVASDWSAQAHSGLAHAQRPDDEAPATSVATVLDTLGGLVSAEAVLAALLLRETAGRTSAVDTSLLSSARMLLRPARSAAGPLFHPVPTAEGYLAVGDTPRARTALGLPSDAGRSDFVRALAADSAASWEKRLQARGTAATRVRTVRDLLSDPALAPYLAHDSGVYVVNPWEFS